MIGQKHSDNVECFSYLDTMIINDVRCTCEIKSRISLAKAAFNKKKTLFKSQFELNLRKKLLKCCVRSIAFCGGQSRTLRKVDQK